MQATRSDRTAKIIRSSSSVFQCAVEHEVDDGIASIDVALGDPKALSPFFRIPGFGRTDAIDDYLASKALVTWSTDIVADDWKRIGAREIVRRAMRRLDAKGRGILLLHDIHPATVLALPILLKELKDRGYRVVHVVATGDHPETIPEPSATTDSSKEWPRVTAVPSAPPVHTLQRHHRKKRHPNSHRTEERT